MSSCLMFGKCNRGWSDAYEETFCVLCSPKLLEVGRNFNLQTQVLIHSEINLYRWRDWIGEF